jgi:molybdenum cofactor cytidylyltransferase
MKLIQALRYSTPVSIAFVGAGGKTTAIFRAARELLEPNTGGIYVQTVLVTTSTHFGSWQAELADHVWKITSPRELSILENQLLNGIILLCSEENNDRLGRIQPKVMAGVLQLAHEYKIPLLIEADGSRTRPLKAPAQNEPAIPGFAQMVVSVVGLAGLGKPLTNEWVHRPEKFAEVTGLQPGEIVTDDALVKLLLSKEGGLKNIPSQARKLVLLNQADTPELQSTAWMIGEKLLPTYQASIITSLSRGYGRILDNKDQLVEKNNGIHAVIEQTGGIILAAGGSSRFGEPKQLLKWKGEALIRHVTRNAINAGLSPVVVVTGSSGEEVKKSIKDFPVRIVINNDWTKGMSTSIKAGLSALLGEVGGVVFLQADQPQIPAMLIRSVVQAHQTSLNPIIAPQIDGQRGNPVLFDVSTFSELLSIEGDVGGRVLFSSYPVEWVPWHDANILMDIDSPEDYLKFLDTFPESEGET